MRRSPLPLALGAVSTLVVSVFGGLRAQEVAPTPARSSVWVVPQSRNFTTAGGIEITRVDAVVSIVDQAATTSLDISLRNPSSARQQAQVLVPVPEGAVLKGFDFQGAASEPTARILPKDEARRIYNAIVAQVRDPALLEFIGLNLLRSSVFPVEPGGAQKLRIVYEHLLEADGARLDYFIPRTESMTYTTPWTVTVRLRSSEPIATVYSPSHAIETSREGPGSILVKTSSASASEPGPFRLSYLVEREGVTASLYAYPDPKLGGGYFLLLAGPPTKPDEHSVAKIQREVTLVIDRSGSMHGEKIEQVREAALQIIAGLEEGESFNILVYSNAVDQFSVAPVIKSAETEKAAREYLKSIRTFGGTNIHDALVEALRQKPREGALPIVLFLTDGLPTVGNTSELAIREIATKANPHQRRVFTFGVGVDVNTALLDRVATETRATASFVLPREDVEVKVASVFRRLAGPVLASPRLEMVGPDGGLITTRIQDVLPGRVPDLFDGDQLVVLGKYRGDDPLHFRLAGNYRGMNRTFEFRLGLDRATTRHSFVPRLWASRQIAVLIDAIRDLGATGTPGVAGGEVTDPRLKELVDEVVRLSTEHGILTEYTAFLALDGTDLTRKNQLVFEACKNSVDRALRVRYGLAGVNQDLNNGFMRQQSRVNPSNFYWDASLNPVKVSGVQQVNDLALYSKNGLWIDSRLVERVKDVAAVSQVVEFGSAEFSRLCDLLSVEGRLGSLAVRGDKVLSIDGKAVLFKCPSNLTESSPGASASQAEASPARQSVPQRDE